MIKTPTQKEARTFFIITLIAAFVGSFFWYLGFLMASIMSFASGKPSVLLIAFIVLAGIAPLVFQFLPLILSRQAYKKNNYKRSISFLWINWISIIIVIVAPIIVIGITLLFNLIH